MQFGRLDSRLQPLTKPLIFEERGDEGWDINIESLSRDRRTNSEYKAQRLESFDSRFSHSGVLLEKSLKFIKQTSKFPMSLRWAVSDKGSIEDLLRKLTELNDYLAELLDTH
ncbi:hypothetical protein BGZ60DRAFT_424849 [Tricladium varicosporioides]|nr:hypothetical protein BGZ60DRAFT_424849 [Hymenoscyphus varicosporioides]